LPFQSRSNVSVRNTRRYEVYITDPSEIALLLGIRNNKIPTGTPETTRETSEDAPTENTSHKAPRKRVRVTLPKRLALLANTPGYHLVIIERLSEHIHRTEQTHAASYQRVQMDISDDTFQSIRAFAKRSRLTVTNATQIIFDEALAEIQTPNNAAQTLKGEDA
jgi:hypothetical protein